MRLWSIHPKYLDSKGLVALWREALLAQKVLHANTKGYRNHPQLERFKKTENPTEAIACYLEEIYNESVKRGYSFNRSKISNHVTRSKIAVTKGQMQYELKHLIKKLKTRDTIMFEKIKTLAFPEPHPIFIIIDGEIETWETVYP